jgi:hypothetical protein
MPPTTNKTRTGIDIVNSAIAELDNENPFQEVSDLLKGRASARDQRDATADICETVLPGNSQPSQSNPSLVVAVGPNSYNAGANSASNPLQVPVGITYATLTQANLKRQRVIIQNVGTTNLFIIFGNSSSFGATNNNYHVKIASGQTYTDEMWVGRIDIVSDLAGGVVSFVENWRSQNPNS